MDRRLYTLYFPCLFSEPGEVSGWSRAVPLWVTVPGWMSSAGNPAPAALCLWTEILLKILSYLDAVALLRAGCVNRRFYHLANDNFIWIRIYSTAFSPKRSNWKVNSVEKTAVSMNSLSAGDKEAGYWKKEYITKQIASVKAALARVLKPLHPCTGLPVKTKEALSPYELPPHSPLSDDSPECGLSGYQLHVDMHSGGVFCLCGTFGNLSTSKEYIENEYMKLSVISFKNSTEHLPLIGKVGLSWKTNIFDGCIKSCSVMDLTLLEEYGKPFWCFSSPVCMRPSPGPSDGPAFLGETYRVDYADAEGRVHLELVWIEETGEYFIVSLALYLRVAKINHWFGTKY
nr:F-box only protein 15 isoform X6 [Globicephala melas]